ncbi:MAG: hypothetical protein CVT70_09260 [Alphaproteobacteria bacterium HGW-Alphaproteobacteria-1]|jgi:hypothetical protein|nr:MAG: hypothetical protein CVT70_09260 [Alphaproteobacteria bacterium HGW-Alphaproteobacteria-1]
MPMTRFHLMMLGAAIVLPAPALAETKWQAPMVQECILAPGAECNVEAECPADMPYVSAGGGGMPMAEPADHAIAMTMNLPVTESKWRVRWRNLHPTAEAQMKGAVRIQCGSDKAAAGW